jgi:PAS domain S-box-containing protein
MTVTHVSELRQQRTQLELLADSLGDWLLWVDADGQIVDVSDRYAALVGFPPGELIGGFPPHPNASADERAEFVEVATATIAGHDRRIEVSLTTGDGTTLPVAVAGSQAPGETGVRAMIAIRDASESRRSRDAVTTAERKLRAIVEATDQAVWVGDADGATEWVNSDMAVLLGEDAGALRGRPIESFMPLALRGQARSAFNAARLDGAARRLHTVLSRSDGADRPVTLRLHPVSDAQGAITGAVATVAEASALTSPAAGRVSADPLDMIGAAVFALDSEKRIRFWNEGAHRLLGYTAAETIGRSAAETFVPDESPELTAARVRALHRSGRWQGEVSMRRRDGTRVSLYTTSVKVDEASTAFDTIDVAIDMTDWKDAQARNEEARSYLGAIANSMADGMYAVTADGRLAFMNPAAERILGWTTSELKGRVMHSVVHYQRADGSAFPGHECPATATSKAGQTVTVDDDVFTRRDGTLVPVAYTASPIRHGSSVVGSVVVFRDISESKRETAELEAELAELTWVERLQDALEGDRLMLYAEPVVDVATGAVVQYRLDVRVLIDGELIAPDEYMRYARSRSIATEIDRWVIRRACKLAAAGATVKFDLATRTIGDPLVRSEFKRLLDETGADPSKIIFGITEEALVGDPEGTTRFAKIVSGLGCQLGLDNFGTGFGGFTYLNDLPVQYMKLDTEFMVNLADDPASQYVVGAAVDLATRFGLKTVAAGVDDQSSAAMLRELRVDMARGRAFGLPGPAREVVAELSR